MFREVFLRKVWKSVCRIFMFFLMYYWGIVYWKEMYFVFFVLDNSKIFFVLYMRIYNFEIICVFCGMVCC